MREIHRVMERRTTDKQHECTQKGKRGKGTENERRMMREKERERERKERRSEKEVRVRMAIVKPRVGEEKKNVGTTNTHVKPPRRAKFFLSLFFFYFFLFCYFKLCLWFLF